MTKPFDNKLTTKQAKRKIGNAARHSNYRERMPNLSRDDALRNVTAAVFIGPDRFIRFPFYSFVHSPSAGTMRT